MNYKIIQVLVWFNGTVVSTRVVNFTAYTFLYYYILLFYIIEFLLFDIFVDHVDDIITMSYQYINMMRAAGPQERIVDEAKDLNLMNFKFKDNEKPLSIVMYMAEGLRVSVCICTNVYTYIRSEPICPVRVCNEMKETCTKY